MENISGWRTSDNEIFINETAAKDHEDELMFVQFLEKLVTNSAFSTERWEYD